MRGKAKRPAADERKMLDEAIAKAIADAIVDTPNSDLKVINPFAVSGLSQSDGWNPLAQLDPNSEHFFEDASALADLLIDGSEPWSASARGVVSAMLIRETRASQSDAPMQPARSRSRHKPRKEKS